MTLSKLAAITMTSLLSASTSATAAWESIAPLPEPNAGFSAGWVQGKILLAGGTNWRDGIKRWLDKVWTYDPASNQWNAGPDLPHPLAYAASGSDGTRLCMAGGTDGKQARPEVHALDKDLKFSLVGTLNQPAAFASGTMQEGRLWIFGGTPNPDDLGQVTTDLLSLPVTGGKITVSAPLRHSPPGIGLPALASTGGHLYSFTGTCVSKADSQVQNFAEGAAHDIKTGTWKAVAPYPFAARGVAAATVDEHRIYLAGGYGTEEQGFLDTAFIYDTRTNTHTPATPLPFKTLTCLVKGGDFLYALGGEDRKKHRSAACYRIPVRDLIPAGR